MGIDAGAEERPLEKERRRGLGSMWRTFALYSVVAAVPVAGAVTTTGWNRMVLGVIAAPFVAVALWVGLWAAGVTLLLLYGRHR